MLQLFDKNKNKIAGLIEYKDLCIESVLEDGDKTLSFLYSKNSKYYFDIEEEGYIRNKQNEFVIKEKDIQDNYTTFICKLNVEELEGKTFDRYESIEQTITAALNLAIVGTGWTVAENNIKKKRTVRKTNCSSWDIIKEIKSIYRVDITFNTLEKKIEIYEHLGQDKGTYFIEDLNLKSLQVQSNSYSYVTRIIPVGKNGLTIESINNNKNYVENYQYSNKVKTIYWNDDRYTIKESLLEDAKAKLNELSKPYRAYTASIINLSKLNPKYNILDYKLGDDITLISKRNKLKEKQRIIKTIEYPQDHNKDTIELANATLKFEDIQTQFQDAADTLDNVTLDDGTLDGEAFEDGGISSNKIDNFKANVIEAAEIHVIKGDIQNLNAAILKAGQAILTKADITQLNSVKAEIQTALIGKANVNELNVAVERVGILEGKTLSVENQLAGNLTAKNFKANSITAGSGIIAEGAIGSVQISDLELNKLRAGDISTSKFRIISANGSIQIVGNQILVNRDNINRVILGEYRKQDNTSDYGLLIRAKDGKTVMIDSEGVHNAGITDGAINNNKVADNANIAGNKLDINSVIREVNGATETIKGTRVQVGDRTLDIELSTQNNTITEHGKELSTQKASIQALDKAIKLKVDNQTFTQSTEAIKGNINSLNSDLVSKINSSLNSAKLYTDNINKNLDTEIKNTQKSITDTTNKLNQAEIDLKKYSDDVATAKANLAKTEAIANADGKITAEEQKRIQQAQINLNTAISKANEAETKAKEYADSKKQEAINTASTDATNKANNALNSAKEFTTAQITTTNSNLSKATSEINILKEQINTKVSQTDIDKSISNITLGGRNLFLKSKGPFKSSNEYVGISITSVAEKYLNKTVTISADVKANRIGKIQFYSLGGYKVNFYVTREITTEWTRIKATGKFTLDDEKQKWCDLSFYGNYGSGLITEVKNVKIELGELESDYTEAPEDTEQLIVDNIKVVTDKINDVSTKLTQTKDSLKASVNSLNSTTQTITTNLTNTTNDLSNKINTAKTDAINSSKSYADTNKIEAITSANSHADSVATTKANAAQSNAIAHADNVATIKSNEAKSQAISSANSYTNSAKQQAIDSANSHANSIAEQKKNEAIVGAREIPDTRNDNQTPDWYMKNYPFQTITEFKFARVVKIPNASNNYNYGTLETKVPWNGSSGGYPTQIFRSSDYPTYQRHGINGTTWSSWEQIEDTQGSQSKADSALNNAKTYTNAQITTVNTRVSNAESSINVLKGQISTKVSQSDIDKTVNNIQIGGRNLLRHSNLFDAGGGANGISSKINPDGTLSITAIKGNGNWFTGFIKTYVGIEDNLNDGDYFTISFTMKSEDTTSKPNIYLKSGIGYCPLEGTLSNEYSKLYYTGIWRKNNQIAIHLGFVNVVGTIQILNCKVEKGNKATDWTPAPEDIGQEIKDNITTVTEKINTVESTLTQKTNNINAAISSVQSILNTKADGSTVSSIQSQVSSLNIGLDGIKSEVAKKTDKGSIISAINQSAENISINASKINLNGATTFAKSTGFRAIEINNAIISFFDWEGSERSSPVGAIYSTRTDRDARKPGIAIGHEENSTFDIVFKKDNKSYSFVTFDNDNILETGFPIAFHKEISLCGSVLWLGKTRRNSMYENGDGNFSIRTAHGLKIVDKDNGTLTADLDANYTGFSKWDHKYFYAIFKPDEFNLSNGKGRSYFWTESGNSNIFTGSGINMKIQGDLTVTGRKNRIVKNTIYGDLALNAVESTECWFTDMLIEQSRTDANGDCIIWFDNKFLQTVNTSYKYKVDVTPIGEFASNGKLTYVRVVEKTEKYFKVRGTPNTLFDWTITAKQKGYERDRLEKAS